MEHEFNFFFENFIDNSPTQLRTVRELEESMKKGLARKPELIPQLIPTFGVGCRRITPGVGYLEALCEDNVSAVTRQIARVSETGVVTSDGTERRVDTIICATVCTHTLVVATHFLIYDVLCRGLMSALLLDSS